jgi:hypothetical protein
VQVARTFYDMRMLGLRHAPLMAALSAAARKPACLDDFGALECSHIAAAVVDLRVADTSLIDTLGEALLEADFTEWVYHAQGQEKVTRTQLLRFLCACAKVCTAKQLRALHGSVLAKAAAVAVQCTAADPTVLA